MPKKLLIVVVLVFVAVVIGVAFGAYLFPQLLQQPYYAVYLSTGEIYIGHLAKFPKMTLTDAYLLQVVRAQDDPDRTDFQLTPLSSAIWAPTKIYLNSDQVIFYAKVSELSRAAQMLGASGGIPQQPQAPSSSQQPVLPEAGSVEGGE